MASTVRSAELAAQLSLEENMRRIRQSFMILIAFAFVLNGWGLLQHLALIPSHDGFIAAVLIAKKAKSKQAHGAPLRETM